MKLNSTKLTAVLLLVVGLIGLCGVAQAASATKVGSVYSFAATGDSYECGPSGIIITGWQYTPSATSKTWYIRVGSSTGTILYTSALSAATTMLYTDLPDIYVPSGQTVYVTSDDTTMTAVKVYGMTPTRPTVP